MRTRLTNWNKRSSTQDSARDPNVSVVTNINKTFIGKRTNETLGLYRSLDNIFSENHEKIILFLGVKGREGTSTIVSDLAKVAAEGFGCRVVILDANMCNPTQHETFRVTPSIGWDQVGHGSIALEDTIYSTNVAGVSIMPISATGVGQDYAVGLDTIAQIFSHLKKQFNFILIDCAPLSESNLAISLGQLANGVVIVLDAQSTRWPVAKMVCEEVASKQVRVIGTVLNRRRYYIPQFLYKLL